MRDLTKGSIIRLMLLFSLPILLGSLFQQAYNLVDIIIVGKKLGELSLSAVGSTTAVVSLMFNIINGLCTGFAIPVAKHYGANDMNKVRRTVAGMITYSAIITAVIMALCIVFVEPLLTALNTPAEIFEQAKLYLTIVAGGLIVTLIYNLEANILRALDDSVVPLIILVISAVLNVGLDFLFIFGFGMGVDGAALATVIAQLISAIVCFVYLIRKCPFLKLGRSDFRLHGEEIKSLLASGLGMALMYSIVDIGSIVLQNGINGLGTGIISAHTAARKIFSFTIMPFSAISATLVTFVSQNLGAGKFDRIKKSIKYGLLIGYGWSTLAVLIVYLFGEQLVLMIAPADNREIIDTAVNYLRINVPFYYALNTLLSLRCTLQGLGKSVVPIGASIVEMIWKIVTVVAVIPVCGYFGVCISEPIIWTASGLLVAVIAIKTLRAFEKA